LKETKCVRCGKPFVDVIAITAFTAIVAVYLFATFFFNLIAPGEPVVAEYLGGAFPIGLEYIAFSSISLLIFMPTMMAGIVPALKKGISPIRDSLAPNAR
jgi:hypothetical protein